MINIGILIFNDIELLDFAGPYEVFSVTNELNNYNLCKTFTIEEQNRTIESVNGLKIIPDYSFKNCPKIDILVIPGGVGTKALLEQQKVLKWVRERYDETELTFSVCSGTRILGKIGLLNNVKYTTHHEIMKDMNQIAPGGIIVSGKKFIDNGKLLTSAGISAGIDLSLYLVEKMFGKEIRERTQRYMEYGDWEKIKV